MSATPGAPITGPGPCVGKALRAQYQSALVHTPAGSGPVARIRVPFLTNPGPDSLKSECEAIASVRAPAGPGPDACIRVPFFTYPGPALSTPDPLGVDPGPRPGPHPVWLLKF